MLHSLVKSGTNAQFAYDHNGQRVKKTVNGVVTEYTLMGKDIVHLKKGADELHFYYDAQGKPGMIRYNGEYYYYLYNLQGDVIAIIDDYANQVMEYQYDPWGKPLMSWGTMEDTLGQMNPFRYRGYVYDEETGLYYLRSRYYNPEWGRFVNADANLGKLGGLYSHNAYCYCYNRIINLSDTDGNLPKHGVVVFGNRSYLLFGKTLDALVEANSAFKKSTKGKGLNINTPIGLPDKIVSAKYSKEKLRSGLAATAAYSLYSWSTTLSQEVGTLFEMGALYLGAPPTIAESIGQGVDLFLQIVGEVGNRIVEQPERGEYTKHMFSLQSQVGGVDVTTTYVFYTSLDPQAQLPHNSVAYAYANPQPVYQSFYIE